MVEESFVGRTRELALLASRARIVTIVGPAGAGKTTLARRHARSVNPAWFVELADAASEADLAARVARALDVPLADRSPIARIGHALAAWEGGLLVLDNAEHLLEATARAAREWLDRCPTLQILATSRERIGISGESLVELGPLPEDDAVRFFFARAAAARSDFGADEEEVRELVRKLDCLPLALELAATRVTILSIEQISRRVERRLDVLTTPRHGMRRAIEWSWDLLDPDARRALAQASVFPGSFDVPAAESVLDVPDALAALDALHRKSLVASSDAPRLSLYAVVRTFARGKLDPGEERAARARHAAFFADAADRVATRIRGGEEVRGLAWLAEESSNLRAAHAWGLENDASLAARIVLALEPLFLHRGPFSDLEAMASSVLATELHGGLRALLLRARAAARRALGHVRTARADLALAASVAEEGSHEQAAALSSLGDVERALGDHAAARPALDRALALASIHGDIELVGTTKRALATLLLDQNRTDEAITTLTGACDAFRRLGVGLREGPALDLLGDIYSVAGDTTRAVALHERALAIHRRVANRRAEGVTLDHLAGMLADQGRIVEALVLVDQALALHRSLGSRYDTAHALWCQAMTLGDAGRHDEARARCEESLGIAREEGATRFEGVALGWLGVAAWEDGDPLEAERMLDRAVELHQSLGIDREELTFRAYRAGLDALHGLAAASREVFVALRERIARQGSPTMLGAACDVLEGLADVSDGDLDAACERELRARASADHFAEVRPAVRLLSRAIAQACPRESGVVPISPSLVVDHDGLWFELSGERVDLTRRRPLRLILRILADMRERRPGAAIPIDEVVDAGWPGERILTDAANARAYSAVRRLRDLGLRSVLRTTGDGYFLTPDVPLERPRLRALSVGGLRPPTPSRRDS
jgi:predicted ATPase